MTTDPNLPATTTGAEVIPTEAPSEGFAPPIVRRPISVAFVPLALTVFTILAFVIAAWTFLAAGG